MPVAAFLCAVVLAQGDGRTTARDTTPRDTSSRAASIRDAVPLDAVPRDTARHAALDTLLARASAANRAVPAGIAGYDADVDSEIALILNAPAGPDVGVAGTAAASTEAAAQVEQLQLRSRWTRAGTLDESLVGYRSRQLGVMISALSFVPRPFTAPSLYGNRLALVFGGRPTMSRRDSAQRLTPAVHPLAEDREQFYAFSGGDTISRLRIAGRTITIVRVVARPRPGHDARLLFDGELFVEAERAALVRLRGRLTLGAPPPGESRIERLARRMGAVREAAYIDFENSEHAQSVWLPRRQRLEYQASTGLAEARATIRVQSVWRNVDVHTADSVATLADTIGLPRYRFVERSRDTAGVRPWRDDLGALTANASAHDFDDVAAPALRPSGSPQWRWQARSLGDFVRYNRVEGLYVGAVGRYDFRDRAPGVTVRPYVGIATATGAVRGGVEAARVRGPWITSLRAERALVSTGDFTIGGGSPGTSLGSLFGVEDVDWVDRRAAALALGRELGTAHARTVRMEVVAGRDRGVGLARNTAPFGGDAYRLNRPVDDGDFVKLRAYADAGRPLLTSPLATGVGGAIGVESGHGQLRWDRMQGSVVARRFVRRLLLLSRVDAAWVRGDAIPFQQLLEAGGNEGLPGESYKAFTGDRAVLGRVATAYLLPVLEKPWRVGPVILPAVAPQLQVGLFGGRVDASDITRARIEPLGFRDSDGWRATTDIRLRFFSGVASVGIARAIDRNDRWSVLVVFGGAL